MTAALARQAARPPGSRHRQDYVRRAGRQGDPPARRQPGLPGLRGAGRLAAVDLLPFHGPGHRDRRGGGIPGDPRRRVRHDGHVLADPVDARQRAGHRRHPGLAAYADRRALRGRGRAVRLRHPGPDRVRAHLPGQRPAVRGVQHARQDRHPHRADRHPVARRPAARCRPWPLGIVPRRRVRPVPDHLRLGEPGDDPDRLASGPGARCNAPHVLAVRLLEPSHRHRPPHHGLARVALVLPRLAARPVHDRGAGGRPARGRGRVRVRIVRALMFVLAAAVILLVLAGTGGFTHPVTV